MDIAALIAWVVTALGGFYMLGVWLNRGGARGGNSRLPASLVSSHLSIAVFGLLVWISYLVVGSHALAWTALVLLAPVALIGFIMLARWIPIYRARATAPAGNDQTAPAERHFPVAVVGAHGLFAITTVVLVLLVALGVGG